MGNIKNQKAHSEIRVDWEFLNDCFPRGIRPTDLDGFVEECGCGLILEHKRPDQLIPTGQEKSFINICEKNKIVVIVFWADLFENGDIKKLYDIKTFAKRHGKIEIKKHDPTIDNLKFLVKKWVRFVEGWPT